MKRFVVMLAVAVLIPAGFHSCKKPEEPAASVSVSRVTLDQTRMDLTEGESRYLSATVIPYHASDRSVSWTSSDPEVATVNESGLVTAVKAGGATITASAGNKSADCLVAVLPKDGPSPDVFPINVVKALQQRSSLVKTLRDSVSYRVHDDVTVTEFQYVDHGGNLQAAFVMQVDLADPRISITNTTPGDGKFDAGIVQREKLSVQFGRIDKAGNRVLGGVNTDFFTTSGTYAGRSGGAFWHKGVCYKDTFDSSANRQRGFVWWGEDEHVSMAMQTGYSKAKSSGKILELFSGGQLLVEDGRLSAFKDDTVSGTHPRTMFGYAGDDRKIVLVVIDGRQNSWSVGVDYPDMQAFMKAIGCSWAINIDGGGSSTFIVRKDGASFTDAGRFLIRNKPSDGTERAIGPGLAVVATD